METLRVTYSNCIISTSTISKPGTQSILILNSLYSREMHPIFGQRWPLNFFLTITQNLFPFSLIASILNLFWEAPWNIKFFSLKYLKHTSCTFFSSRQTSADPLHTDFLAPSVYSFSLCERKTHCSAVQSGKRVITSLFLSITFFIKF